MPGLTQAPGRSAGRSGCLDQVLDAHVVTACELFVGYQAMALSGRQPPPGCQRLLDWLAGVIGPIDGDRPFGVDIEHLIEAAGPAG